MITLDTQKQIVKKLFKLEVNPTSISKMTGLTESKVLYFIYGSEQNRYSVSQTNGRK